MPPSPIDFLFHIRDECIYIESRMNGLSRQSLQVPATIRRKYASVDWKAMAGMRDRLVHDYFGIDYEIVWDVAQNKIPALKHTIEQIIQQETKQ